MNWFEFTYGLLMLLHLMHDIGSLREGKRRSQIVANWCAGRDQGIVHQRVNTVRWWPVLRTVDELVMVVVVVVVVIGGAAIASEGCRNVVIVQDDILIDFHHSGLSRW